MRRQTAAVGAGILVGFVTGVMTGVSGQAQRLDTFEGTMTHVGVVVPDIERAVRTYADLWGIEAPRIQDGLQRTANIDGVPLYPPGSTYTGTARFAQLPAGGVTIELLQPVRGTSPWSDHLDKCGAAVHHLAYRVTTGRQENLDLLRRFGGRLTMGGVRNASYAYIDLRPELGYTIELIAPLPDAQGG